jgi:toluene monooxygenase system ferredoxin subunit
MGRSMVWKVACSEDAIGQNDLKEFDIDGVTVLLARVGEEYFAYPPLCPHQEEPLRKGLCDGESITCFKHIWQWDVRTGACTGTESRIPLKMYQVRKAAGQVEVLIEQPLVYEYDA